MLFFLVRWILDSIRFTKGVILFRYNMLFWSIQIIVSSFLFIFLIHHLFTFFKNTLTTPKVKDLVNIHTEKYNAIYDVLHQQPSLKKEPPDSQNRETIDIRSLLLPVPHIPQLEEPSNMKNELKSFLKKQMHESSSNSNNPNNDFHSSSTSIDFLDSKIGFTSFE